jgi:hypothetical protein
MPQGKTAICDHAISFAAKFRGEIGRNSRRKNARGAPLLLSRPARGK